MIGCNVVVSLGRIALLSNRAAGSVERYCNAFVAQLKEMADKQTHHRKTRDS